ncbi:MAG: ATP-binding cassette domain-containing protein [Rhodobacteraceae bacterium]|nr:ATP-binding cassette domain-containing protein [Paracoccaceae bacterium]
MLALKNIEIVQGDFRLTADIELQSDQTTAILGPSGGGKSTLLTALAGFVAHSGDIFWRGKSLKALAPADRPVSMLFQEHNLFPHLSITQNVGLGLRPDLKLSAAEKAKVETALNRVGLAGKGASLPRALSGGQRQRAALARALLRQKPIWLLDEPFAALGPGLRQEMLELVEEIRAEQGATLLLVTHAPEDAKRIASEVVFVEAGQAHPAQATGPFFAHPSSALRAYLGN